ncbi:MAG: DUF899 family protein, partial [Terriglobales bacterium]
TLAQLFRGRSQLLVYHFMFGPEFEAGCPACSSIADGFNGIAAHLAGHDVMLTAVSRAPLAKLQAFQKRMGWRFPWASSAGNRFNFYFTVSLTEAEQLLGGTEYNYRPVAARTPEAGQAWKKQLEAKAVPEHIAMTGADAVSFNRERPGMSAFVLEDGSVYHTYSAFARGLDDLWGMYQWLDRAPKGRNESGGWWLRHHDRYEQ